LAWKSIFSIFSNDLAIDLGTANTLVFARGKGIIVREPSIVAVNTVTNRVEAVGTEAKEMLGRTPGNIVAIRPMKDGVIADFEVTEKMLDHFIKKAHGRSLFVRPRIVISVPSGITQVEKRAVQDSALRAGASEVFIIEQAMASAIGSGLQITEPTGIMIVDFVGGTLMFVSLLVGGLEFASDLSKSLRAEVQWHTLPDLMTLPISARQLLWSKVAGILPAMVPYAVCFVVGAMLGKRSHSEAGGYAMMREEGIILNTHA
jgi:hypothetical protein